MTTERQFESFISFEEFANGRDLKIARTTKGSILMISKGNPVAVIQNKLKEDTLEGTIEAMCAVNLCVGIPQPGNVDQSGRPSLPCVMESTSSWEVLDFDY